MQLLAINDFHGSVETPDGSEGAIGHTAAGGAEYLATHLKNAVRQNPHSVIVAAGDLIGGSPLLSALFHDEPTIEALNAINLAVSSVGNHEFDRGWQELTRLQRGGCHPTSDCRDRRPFAGARFRYLAANVVATQGASAVPQFPPTAVVTTGGVKIGFIGETLTGTPRLVVPSGVQGLTFLDEATTANRYAADLERQGVNAIVLLIHEGGFQGADADPNGCNDFTGSLLPIVRKLSDKIRVVISGHTHQAYNCTIAGHHVTSASSHGRMITRIDLAIDPLTDTIAAVTANNEIVTRDVARDPVQTRILAEYSPRAAAMAARVVGSVVGNITRASRSAGESALGDLIADAQLAATRSPDRGGAVVAFMNPGGIRADLASSQAPNDLPRPVTYGELFAIQPFGNRVTVMTLTGDMVGRLLEQQFDNPSPGRTLMLQVSAGFSYRYRSGAPAGPRVDPNSIRINGRAISPAERVRIAANDVLAAGGAGFTAFGEGFDRVGGEVDLEALIAYFGVHSPVRAGPQDRITRVE